MNDHRATRLEIYAQWLADDIDGIAYNATDPTGKPIDGATKILATVRDRLTTAIEKIDHAIAANGETKSMEFV